VMFILTFVCQLTVAIFACSIQWYSCNHLPYYAIDPTDLWNGYNLLIVIQVLLLL
jgi:hypothetical protein